MQLLLFASYNVCFAAAIVLRNRLELAFVLQSQLEVP